MAWPGVIGRAAELAAAGAFLDALADGPAALVVSGEAGIGKSVVLGEASSAARSRDWSVLDCRPAQAETKLTFSALADLLAEHADPVLRGLPRPQRLALEAALLRVEPEAFAADWRAVGAAFRAALGALAAERPICLVVDDVQWLDGGSRRVLEFAVRRLDTLPVGLLLAVRMPDAGASPLGVDRALPPERVGRIELGPMSVGALYQIIRARLGRRVPRPAMLRIARDSGGNPLYALELARELERTGSSPSPWEPLPLPATLTGLMAQRIGRLPAGTRAALLVASAASAPTVALVAAASGLPAEALDRAVSGGVVRLERTRVVFAHPLLGSAVYASAPAGDRRRAHRRLAAIVGDPEERARHLALAAGRRDGRVAAALDSAAERVAARGAPAEAAELCCLAAELTPLRLEGVAAERRLRAARHYGAAGALEQADEILDGLLSAMPAGPARAAVLLERASLCRSDYVRMTALCEQALAEARDDEQLRARIHEQLSHAWHLRGEPAQALADARAGLALARNGGDERVRLMLVAATGRAETWALGEVTPGLLEEGVEREAQVDEALPFDRSPGAALGVRHLYAGRMDAGRTLLEAAYARAAGGGDELSRAAALLQLAALELFAGRWDAAEAHADEGIALEEQMGAERGVLQSYRGLVAACRGQADAARLHAQTAILRARAIGEGHVELLAEGVIGFTELSLGNAERAAHVLGGVLERDAAGSQPKTSRYYDDGIEALVAVGHVERARVYADLYSRAAIRSPMVIARAKACRARGLVAAADGDLDLAVVELARSLEWHRAGSQPFERARALLDLGVVKRRAKRRREAREALEEALAAFEGLPAPLFAARAHAELSRTGARRRAEGGLTETEQLVAGLAAEGLTNREIARRAFLSPKSVEDVLRRVYRTLGVRNKAELAGRYRQEAAGETTVTPV